MSTERPGVIVLAETPEPPGVRSNIGHPSEPVVITVSVDGPAPVVSMSEGSGHLGSGGTFTLDEVLTENGVLQDRWLEVFTRADALWAVPVLDDLARGVLRTSSDVVEAIRTRRPGGRPPLPT